MRWAALLLLWLAAGASAGEGEIYTWKDKEGRTNYADTPPPGNTPARTLSGRAIEKSPASVAPADGPSPADARTAPTPAEQELELRKRRAADAENQAKADRAKLESDEKLRNCERARRQLTALESGQRVARLNEKGEAEVLDDAQRAQEMEAARKAADAWCK